jgi:hypothetical protein
MVRLLFGIMRARSGRCPALFENGVELPSNFLGIGYVPYDSTDGWKIRLVHEIEAS